VKNSRFKLIAIVFLLCAVILQSFTVYGATEKDNWLKSSSSLSNALKFEFKDKGDWEKVTGVKVNDVDYSQTDKSTDLIQGNRFYKPDAGYLEYYISLSKNIKSEDTIKFITSTGWFEVKVSNPDHYLSVHNKSSVKFVENTEVSGGTEGNKPETSAKITLKLVKIPFSNDYYFEISPKPQGNELKGVSVDGAVYKAGTSKYAPYGGGNNYYYSDGKLYMIEPKDGAVITLTYSDGKKHSFDYKRGSSEIAESDEVQVAKVLKLRLKGAFEGAMSGQRAYDGIAGASLSVTQNKNSNVVLQGAEKENPAEEDWKLFKDLGLSSPEITIDSASGMKGVYNPYNSEVTLSGTPKDKGKYEVKAVLKEASGRVTESNSLDFNVYDGNGTLEEYLNVEKYGSFFRKMHDGKYIWDMEPWSISKFGGTNETVTVPENVKAWYGSHTSGTYGELGTSSGEATQTLIVGKDTNLTLVNMKVLSSVKIIVKDGGVLNVMDSSIHGKIEVENGGVLQVNYNTQTKSFGKGSSINGQIELKEGGILENSLIYSNTNYLPDGNRTRLNVSPVVKVTGNATIRGKVYIRGDEAPTGTDPETGKLYTGQPALGVENSTLTISEGGVLGTYGGGRTVLTSIAAPAIKLNNGKIEGEGSLIAIAGRSTMPGENGQVAVAGNGSLDVANMYIQGGDTYNKNGRGGNGLDKNVVINETANKANPVGKVLEGKTLGIPMDNDQPYYWKDNTKEPSMPDFGNEAIKITASSQDNQPNPNPGVVPPVGNNNLQPVVPVIPTTPGIPAIPATPGLPAIPAVPVAPVNNENGSTETIAVTNDSTPEGKAETVTEANVEEEAKEEGKTVKSVDGIKEKTDLENVEEDGSPLGNTNKDYDKANLPKTGAIPTQLYFVAGLGLLALGFGFRKQIIK
jgi:hypothetical protein